MFYNRQLIEIQNNATILTASQQTFGPSTFVRALQHFEIIYLNIWMKHICDNLLLILWSICALIMLTSSMIINFKFSSSVLAWANGLSNKFGHSAPNFNPNALCTVTPSEIVKNWNNFMVLQFKESFELSYLSSLQLFR